MQKKIIKFKVEKQRKSMGLKLKKLKNLAVEKHNNEASKYFLKAVNIIT